MKLPNKITSYKESILGKFYPVLNLLKQKDLRLYELYNNVRGDFATLGEFLEALDCLFALGKIELIEKDNEEILHYAS